LRQVFETELEVWDKGLTSSWDVDHLLKTGG
jgi:hypothetical protein